MDRLIRFLSKSISVIFTLTTSPTCQNVRRLVDPLVGDLADVDQAVHTGDDLSKGAELGERYDLGLDNSSRPRSSS